MLLRWEKHLGVRRATLLLSLPLGLLAALLSGCVFSLPGVLADIVAQNEWLGPALRREGVVPGLGLTFAAVLAATVVVLLSGSIIGLVKRLWALSCLRFCYFVSYATGLFYAYVVTRVGDVIEQTTRLDDALLFQYGGPDTVFPWYTRWFGAFSMRQLLGGIDKVTTFKAVYSWCWPVFLAMIGIGFLHLTSWRRFAVAVYRGYHDDSEEPGDALVEDLRTHGRDPEFRRRLYASTISHLLIFIIIPWLLQFYGCVTPYRVPKGSGNPVVAMVAYARPRKQPKKQFVLNPDSLVYLKIPDPDDSQVFQDVEEHTLLTYKATATAKAGAMGAGGGTTGGWPDGMEDHLVRFIRLKYDGPGWDDGMDAAQGADQNFLKEFHKLTGFKIAKEGEAHRIGLLRKYPKGYAPPFVYLTGYGHISASASDVQVLRDYLFDGGMLFADAGSATFDSSFRAFISRVLPEYPLLNIADDDPIFLMPYTFPHGAPPLWHHGGKRALGVKYKNRWIVFYHPGDVNDAWKIGRSGLSTDQADGAYQMGVNIVYYAFTHYLAETRKYRR